MFSKVILKLYTVLMLTILKSYDYKGQKKVHAEFYHSTMSQN